MSEPRVVIAAGGTAGHVVPAIAVADALRAEGADVRFVGGERAEAELVPGAGYELDPLNIEGISRSNPLKAARAVGRAGLALGAARKILKHRRPDAVLGGGGYVAGPVGAAAAFPTARAAFSGLLRLMPSTLIGSSS
ncbi:MAG: glycosyltransferase [Solirubrobacteraceae bacterium]